MKKNKIVALIIGIVMITPVSILFAWGTWGHQHINRAAVFALPDQMRVFFYNHLDYVTEESVGPDIRKYTLNDKAENPRHYIDIEAFEKSIDSLPRAPKDAYTAYKDSFLRKNGILPWYIQETMDKLTKAFKEKRKTEILFLAADLGHYLGDAHMPLHTSLNHDGQLTNQKGIHAFWESQLPEQFGEAYNLCTPDAKIIADIPQEVFRIIKNSSIMSDTLLSVERVVNAKFPAESVYKKDEKGNVIKNKFFASIHSKEYAAAYHDALKGMVERQIRGSISATADFWYTAWVNAGKPDLTSIDDDALTQQNKKSLTDDYAAWKKGKVTKLKIDTEF